MQEAAVNTYEVCASLISRDYSYTDIRRESIHLELNSCLRVDDGIYCVSSQ